MNPVGVENMRWCPESKIVDGKMVCLYTSCVLKESEIEKIMQYVLNKERKG